MTLENDLKELLAARRQAGTWWGEQREGEHARNEAAWDESGRRQNELALQNKRSDNRLTAAMIWSGS
jgi:hypothetical protein